MAKVPAEESQPSTSVGESRYSRPDHGEPSKCNRLRFLHLQIVETFGQLRPISGQQTCFRVSPYRKKDV